MNKQLKNSIDKILDENVSNLSAEVCSKLNQSRELALSQSQKRTSHRLFWALPLATSVVLSVVFITPLIKGNNKAAPSSLPIILNNEINLADEIDLAEDLDFYLWLAQNKSINT